MLDTRGSSTNGVPNEVAHLVDALATYLKTSIVYPENNPGVREAMGKLREWLAHLSPHGHAVEFVVSRGGVSALGNEISANRPLIAWLRDRFAHARIAGVGIAPRSDPLALTAFASCLRQSFPPGAPPLQELWRQGGKGVEPIMNGRPLASRPPGQRNPPEPMMDAPRPGAPSPRGRSSVAASLSPFPQGAPTPQSSSTPAGDHSQAPSIRSPALDAVLQHLARSDPARRVLAQMHQSVEQEYRGTAQLDVSAMLEAIVGELPNVLCARPETATREIEAVLDALLTQMEGFLLARPADPGSRMTHMAATMARRRFSNATDGPAPAGPSPPRPATQAPRFPSVAPPVGTVVDNPFALPPADSPNGRTETTIGAARADLLDAFALPGDAGSLGRPSAGPRLPPPGAADAEVSLGVRPSIREDSFETFLEGVRSEVGARAHPHDRRAEGGRRATAPMHLEDDLGALAEEIRALPNISDLGLDANDSAIADGVLGAGLYALAYAQDGASVAASVERLLESVLRAPSPNQKRVLTRWLRFAREGGPNGTQDDANQRLFDFLQRNGIAQMLSTRETLGVEQVVQTFPTQLVAFLDGLDGKDPRSEQLFAELFDAVGEESMGEAARVLVADGTLLTPHRTEKVLKLGGRRSAVIARHYVMTGAAWTRALVVNFLRRQSLPRQEAAALSIVQPLASFPNGYLADLCDCVARGKANFKLHGYTSLLLRQYIRDTAENPGDLDRRLYAIRALAHWPTPETLQYLEQLSKEGRLLSQTKEARAVRQAATETLKAIRESSREQP